MRADITILLLITWLTELGGAQVSQRPRASQPARISDSAQATQFRLPQAERVTGAHYPAVPASQRPYHEHRALLVPKGPIRPQKTISPPTSIHQSNRQLLENPQRPISMQSEARELRAAFHLDPGVERNSSLAMAVPYFGPDPPPPTPVDILTNTDFGLALSNDRDGEE